MKKVLVLSTLLVLIWSISALAVTSDQLAEFLPNTLGEFQAKTEVKKESIALPGFIGVARKYAHNTGTLSVTVLGLPKKANLSIKPATKISIKGMPAQLKIVDADEKKVIVLIDLAKVKGPSPAGKIMIMISHKGTTDKATVLNLAEQFDFQGLRKLF